MQRAHTRLSRLFFDRFCPRCWTGNLSSRVRSGPRSGGSASNISIRTLIDGRLFDRERDQVQAPPGIWPNT